MIQTAVPAPISRQRARLLTGVLALIIVGVATSHPGPGTNGRGLVILALSVLSSASWLVWIWGAPTPAVSDAAIGVMAVSSGMLIPAAPDGPASAFAFAAIVSAGVRYDGVRPTVVLLLTVVAVAGGSIVYDQSAVGVVAYAAGMLAATFASTARRDSLQRAEGAELLLAQTQRSREEQLRAAALDERNRIAREIHDVLAHSLAGLTIDLEATRMLIEQGADRERVLERVGRAHALAREGLQETRRAIQVLRDDAPRVSAQLQRLIGEFETGTGTGASLEVYGDIDALAADAALAIVRVAQESLTNARKHAPGGAVTVVVALTTDEAVLTVQSAGRSGAEGMTRVGTELATSGGGYGLRGMRERAEILGGTLAAGPMADGGWLVELRLALGTGKP